MGIKGNSATWHLGPPRATQPEEHQTFLERETLVDQNSPWATLLNPRTKDEWRHFRNTNQTKSLIIQNNPPQKTREGPISPESLSWIPSCRRSWKPSRVPQKFSRSSTIRFCSLSWNSGFFPSPMFSAYSARG